jgi:hypothetical protein
MTPRKGDVSATHSAANLNAIETASRDQWNSALIGFKKTPKL